MNSPDFLINFTENGALKKIEESFQGVREVVNQITGSIKDNWAERLTGAASQFNQISTFIQKTSSSVEELSATTDQTGGGLGKIGEFAQNTIQQFGGGAANAIENYKNLLSQLGPEITKVPSALNSLGDHISTLSKTIGGDTKSAVDLFKNAMTQLGNSTAEPMEASNGMAGEMNLMTKAAKGSSDELPFIKVALQQVGVAAQGVGINFEGANAAIGVLDKLGERAAEGGNTLQNVFTSLSQSKFLPKGIQEGFAAVGTSVESLSDKNKSLSEKFTSLAPIMNGKGGMITKLFGKKDKQDTILSAEAVQTETLKEPPSNGNNSLDKITPLFEGLREGFNSLMGGISQIEFPLQNVRKMTDEIGIKKSADTENTAVSKIAPFTSNIIEGENEASLEENLSETSESIAGGGQSVKIFNITIGSLIGENSNIFNSSSDDPSTAENFMQKLAEALKMVVNDVNYAAV